MANPHDRIARAGVVGSPQMREKDRMARHRVSWTARARMPHQARESVSTADGGDKTEDYQIYHQ